MNYTERRAYVRKESKRMEETINEMSLTAGMGQIFSQPGNAPLQVFRREGRPFCYGLGRYGGVLERMDKSKIFAKFSEKERSNLARIVVECKPELSKIGTEKHTRMLNRRLPQKYKKDESVYFALKMMLL